MLEYVRGRGCHHRLCCTTPSGWIFPSTPGTHERYLYVFIMDEKQNSGTNSKVSGTKVSGCVCCSDDDVWILMPRRAIDTGRVLGSLEDVQTRRIVVEKETVLEDKSPFLVIRTFK